MTICVHICCLELVNLKCRRLENDLKKILVIDIQYKHIMIVCNVTYVPTSSYTILLCISIIILY